ncbi:DUF4011 domain-containing protein [Streptomyces sp. SAT1]|uniref:DUF4011 domain-containing protein n=1 Tax=Streptomyces sp. SAT1 TaxID=1849967 RepID=UPI000A8F0845|nr:DUF4011 domain-containing protein [Streptomyces sp. SAT1]
MTSTGGFGAGGDLQRLKTMLAGWRTSLVDLSGRNRLLNFRHTRSATLEISYPSAEELVERLDRGWDFAPLPDEEPEPEESEEPSSALPAARGDHSGGIVTQKRTAPSLLRALNSLRGKSTQLFNDYGLWTLNLGVGMLRWREDAAESSSDAPLILLPVVMERMKNGRIRLRANEEEEPRFNPALKVKLEQFHIDWTHVAEQDPTDLRAVLSAAAHAVEGKSGWQVSDRVVVALFASHKESMYQDLLENEGRVLASDLVRAMALGPDAGLASDRFDFEEIELDRIDELSPPEDRPLVLDADASQRQAIAAAVAGQSFVLDGPPGTGKSQTITNMIAGLMHAGRSVLFVSEKAAALDVVLDRLRSVGLDSYALALHSHSTSRKAVAQELGRALAEEPRAPQLSQQAVAQARKLRLALSAYAEAMNEERAPLGRTLHDVIGRVGQLADAPVAYPASGDGAASTGSAVLRAADLSADDLRSIVEATKAISASWEAVADPSFPWRRLRSGMPHPRPVLEQAQAALDGLATAVDRYRDLALDAAPATDQAALDRLIALLHLLDSRSPVPEKWLTTAAFADDIEDPADAFLAELRRAHRSGTAARTRVGERWRELSTRLTAERSDAEKSLTTMSPPGLDPAALTEEQARELADRFDATAGRLERTHQTLLSVSRTTGLAVPGSVEDARHLCAVIGVAAGEHRPLARWLVPDGAWEAEEAAVRVIADALAEFLTRRDNVLAAQALAASQAGPGWADLGAELSAERPADEQALTELEPPGIDIAALPSRAAAELADWLEALADTLETAGRRADSMAAELGCDRPKTTSETEDLATLIESADTTDRARETWLDPQRLPVVRAAVADISAAAEELSAAEQAASGVFLPELVSAQGLPDAVRRLTDGRQGLVGMLSSSIRADRKLVAALTHAGSWRSELYDKLHLADAWYTAHRNLRSLATEHAELTGRYRGRNCPTFRPCGRRSRTRKQSTGWHRRQSRTRTAGVSSPPTWPTAECLGETSSRRVRPCAANSRYGGGPWLARCSCRTRKTWRSSRSGTSHAGCAPISPRCARASPCWTP